jgi:hypothetical protein
MSEAGFEAQRPRLRLEARVTGQRSMVRGQMEAGGHNMSEVGGQRFRVEVRGLRLKFHVHVRGLRPRQSEVETEVECHVMRLEQA